MHDTLVIAQTYDRLLARRDFDGLEGLFAEDAVYLSPGVGHYRGKAAVMAMLRGFFSRHPTASWTNARWRLEQGDVLHDYELSVPTAPAALRARSGIERMSFDGKGLISRIVVTG